MTKEEELKEQVIKLQNLAAYMWSMMNKVQKMPPLPDYVFEKP